MKKEEQVFAKGICYAKLFWIFCICSLVGWVLEVIWGYIRLGRIENRSAFIYGPVCAIYGAGAVLITLLIWKIKQNNYLLVFLTVAIVGTVLEYGISWAEETFFGQISWRYHHLPFNINGRVCLLFSIVWGILGVLWVRFGYPMVSRVIEKFPYRIGKVATVILTVFLLFDMVLSQVVTLRYHDRLDGIQPKNRVERFIDHHYTNEYLTKVFPNKYRISETTQQ